jgi:serine/threonine-protein kinase
VPEAGRGERVAALFDAAIDRPAPERHAFVLAAAESEEVRREVLSLLDALGRAEARPDRLDPQRAAALLDADPPHETLTGRRIGPYRLLSVLGRGGMGVVYLAERADGAWQQQVALKLLPPALASGALAERFLLERRILARLEHPGIARLLDGGLTDDGDPYFVLEYVEGEPLTDWCNRRRLALEERLRLFRRVCEAVQYAHGRLVVHRDLKPSNILVTPAGEVKLLDFGIARLLDAEGGADATVLTRLGLQPYTPGYAAPEQLRGEAVTVATDVYALGVLLHELLVGRRPRPAAALPTPPTRPSAAARRSGGASPEGTDGFDPEAAAHARGTSPERLARRLAGDLDTIVLQALREEPERRYESAQALADDVRRHLEGHPVAARPAGAGYVAGRFLRRHRVGVAAAALVAFAAAAGLAATTWQARVAARERDAARLEAAKLTAVQGYLVGLFRAADPAEARGEEVTARQLLIRGIERLEGELVAQPEVRLEMSRVLARVSLQLGEYERAERLLRDALPLARRLHGPGSVEEADLTSLRGALLVAKGEWESAEAELRESLAAYRRVGAEAREEAIEAFDQLGAALERQGKEAEAVAVYREGLPVARRVHGDRSPSAATLLNALGLALRGLRDLDAAEEALRESLAIFREVHGPDHPDVATATINLAGVLRNRGKLLEAEPLYREAAAAKRRILGENHPEIAVTLHNLAAFLHSLGRYDEAAGLHRQGLAVLREHFGDEHPHTGAMLDALANDLAAAQDFASAMPLFDQARDLLLRTTGTEHWLYGLHRLRVGRALHAQGRNREALEAIDEAAEVVGRVRGADHPELAGTLRDRGRVRLALGDLDAAEADLRLALEIQQGAASATDYASATTLVPLAKLLLARGRAREAEPLARDAARILGAALPDGHQLRTEAEAALAAIERSLAAPAGD